jgi:hypothetical protein
VGSGRGPGSIGRGRLPALQGPARGRPATSRMGRTSTTLLALREISCGTPGSDG